MLTAHVINLERRRDRRENFERANALAGLEFEFQAAVDGRALDYESLIGQGILDPSAQAIPPATVACALSHKQIWERCVEEGRGTLIFEDDAILRRDFVSRYRATLANLPSGWHYLSLACNFDSIIRFEIFPGQNLHGSFGNPRLTDAAIQSFAESHQAPALFRLLNCFGACAYTVSPKGAEEMLRSIFPLRTSQLYVPVLNRTIIAASHDAMMNLHFDDLEAWCVMPPLAISPNDPADSDLVNSPPAPAALTEGRPDDDSGGGGV